MAEVNDKSHVLIHGEKEVDGKQVRVKTDEVWTVISRDPPNRSTEDEKPATLQVRRPDGRVITMAEDHWDEMVLNTQPSVNESDLR